MTDIDSLASAELGQGWWSLALFMETRLQGLNKSRTSLKLRPIVQKM